jgi:transcriptional regulator with XRE-family HTH domain
MDLAGRFKHWRRVKDWKQEALSAKSGVSRKHISAIESGVSDPSFKMLEGLLRSMDVSLADFFESRIPDHYENPEHQDLHEQLQEILETGDEHQAECIKTAVRMFHTAITTARTAPKSKARHTA